MIPATLLLPSNIAQHRKWYLYATLGMDRIQKGILLYPSSANCKMDCDVGLFKASWTKLCLNELKQGQLDFLVYLSEINKTIRML